MMQTSPTIEDTRDFWPAPIIYDGIDLTDLLEEIQLFALDTFDRLDLDGNGFISADELDAAMRSTDISLREKNFIHFLLVNVEAIGRAFDDHDGISPCGISRNDIIAGISRSDLVEYFGRM
jgi:hypothetical protein